MLCTAEHGTRHLGAPTKSGSHRLSNPRARERRPGLDKDMGTSDGMLDGRDPLDGRGAKPAGADAKTVREVVSTNIDTGTYTSIRRSQRHIEEDKDSYQTSVHRYRKYSMEAAQPLPGMQGMFPTKAAGVMSSHLLAERKGGIPEERNELHRNGFIWSREMMGNGLGRDAGARLLLLCDVIMMNENRLHTSGVDILGDRPAMRRPLIFACLPPVTVTVPPKASSPQVSIVCTSTNQSVLPGKTCLTCLPLALAVPANLSPGPKTFPGGGSSLTQ